MSQIMRYAIVMPFLVMMMVIACFSAFVLATAAFIILSGVIGFISGNAILLTGIIALVVLVGLLTLRENGNG